MKFFTSLNSRLQFLLIGFVVGVFLGSFYPQQVRLIAILTVVLMIVWFFTRNQIKAAFKKDKS